MNTHKAKVRRTTRGYQLGAVALLAGAGAAVALPLGEMLGPKAPASTGGAHTDAGGPAPAPPMAMELGDAADVLKKVIAWKPAPVEPPKPADTEGEAVHAAAPPTPPPGEWAYLGSVMMNSTQRALVRIDTDQHMLRPGATERNTRLLEINPKYITVETNGQQRRIELAARTSMFPTEPPKRGPVRPGGPTAMNQNGISPGKTPASFDQARAEEMAKRRAMAAPPTRPLPIDADARAATELKEKMAQDPGSARDHYEKTLKAISDPSVGPEARVNMLRDLGITPGTSPDAAFERFRSAGINPDEHPELIEAVKNNSKEGR